MKHFRGPKVLVETEKHPRKEVTFMRVALKVVGEAPDPFPMYMIDAAVAEADEAASS
jgi:hypothetical protein